MEADLPPGIYEVECYVGDHASKGMRAILEVRADAPLQTPDAGTARPGTARIVQFAFVPAIVQVDTGSAVTWTNDDPAPHTVTADDGTFDSKQMEPGADYAVVFDRARDLRIPLRDPSDDGRSRRSPMIGRRQVSRADGTLNGEQRP